MVFLFFSSPAAEPRPPQCRELARALLRWKISNSGSRQRGPRGNCRGVPPPSHPPAAHGHRPWGGTMRDRCAPPPRSLPPWSSSPLLRPDEAPGGRYAASSPQHLLSHRLPSEPSAPSRLEQEHGQNRAESQVLPALLPPAQELHIATAAGSSLWR